MSTLLSQGRRDKVVSSSFTGKQSSLSRVGRPEAEHRPDILLSGQEILEEHCDFVNEDGSVTLIPKPRAKCYLNGRPINSGKFP